MYSHPDGGGSEGIRGDRDEEYHHPPVGAMQTAESPSAPAFMPRQSGAASHGRRGSSCWETRPKWIWGIPQGHFPGATEIVDLYHAREHLAKVAKLLYGVKAPAIPGVAFGSPR